MLMTSNFKYLLEVPLFTIYLSPVHMPGPSIFLNRTQSPTESLKAILSKASIIDRLIKGNTDVHIIYTARSTLESFIAKDTLTNKYFQLRLDKIWD